MEEWRDIEGYEGIYQISNYGRVKRLDTIIHTAIKYVSKRAIKGGVLKLSSNNRGYKTVMLSNSVKRKKYFVHRLVAKAFIENPNNYPVVNHKDENPSNNMVENLEWCTQRYNMNWRNVMARKVAPKLRKTEEEKKRNRQNYIQEHKEEIKAYKRIWYIKNRKPKGKFMKGVEQYDKNNNFIKSYCSIEEAKRQTGISHINCACSGKRKTAGGYIWKYQ